MPRVSPVPMSEATDKVEQTYSRLKEMFESEELPEMFLIYGRVPAFLSDFYMNFKKFVYTEGKLDVKTKTIIGLAVSAFAKCGPWTDWFTQRGKSLGLDEQSIADILAVSATNTMYNTFFKFRDLAESDVFQGMPVGLRAHTFSNTSLDEKTVELIDLALSDINACRPCVTGHLKKGRSLGISDEAILETIQCAAVVYCGCQFLTTAGY